MRGTCRIRMNRNLPRIRPLSPKNHRRHKPVTSLRHSYRLLLDTRKLRLLQNKPCRRHRSLLSTMFLRRRAEAPGRYIGSRPPCRECRWCRWAVGDSARLNDRSRGDTRSRSPTRRIPPPPSTRLRNAALPLLCRCRWTIREARHTARCCHIPESTRRRGTRAQTRSRRWSRLPRSEIRPPPTATTNYALRKLSPRGGSRALRRALLAVAAGSAPASDAGCFG